VNSKCEGPIVNESGYIEYRVGISFSVPLGTPRDDVETLLRSMEKMMIATPGLRLNVMAISR